MPPTLACPRCSRVFEQNASCPGCAWTPQVGLVEFEVVSTSESTPSRVHVAGVDPGVHRGPLRNWRYSDPKWTSKQDGDRPATV